VIFLSEELLPDEIEEERIYTVPLKKAKYVARKKRAEKAIRLLRSFIARHMKSDDVIINPKLNEEVWAKGIEKPPSKIKVKAVKTREGAVIVLKAED